MSQPALSEGPARVDRWPRRASDSGARPAAIALHSGPDAVRPAVPGASSRRNRVRLRAGEGGRPTRSSRCSSRGPSILPGPRPGFPTSIGSWAAGLSRGSVVLLAGPPGIGKSTLLLQWLSSMAGRGSWGCSCPARSPVPRSRRAPAASVCRWTRSGSHPAEISTRSSPRRGRPARRAGGRFRPGAARRRGDDAARRGRPGPAVHRRAGGACEGTGHRRRAGRARHEGRGSRRPAGARARGRCRLDVRGRSALRAPGGLGGQEPVRDRGRVRLVPDGGRRLGVDRSVRPALLRRTPSGVGGRPAAGGPPGARRRDPGLVGGGDGAARRQVTGLDLRRFQQVAAVVERSAAVPLGRAELFGAVAGGIRVDDPASDLAVAAALVSAAAGVAPPAGSGVRRRDRAHGPDPCRVGDGATHLRRPGGRVLRCSSPPAVPRPPSRAFGWSP